MALKTVQTYELDANGILKPVDGLVFSTDTSGTVILGGKCNDSAIINVEYPYLNHSADGSWGGPYSSYGTSVGIGAGSLNCTVNAQASYIGAGQENFISGQTTVCFIRIGGITDFKTESFGTKSFIGAGAGNKICSPKSAIIGGHGNTILGTTCYYGSLINNFPQDEYKCYNVAFAEGEWKPFNISYGPGYNVVAGGKNNCLNGIFSVIGGGLCNNITSNRGFIPDGYGSYYVGQLSGQYNFLGGGFSNLINNSCTATIAGGNDNTIDKSNNSSILGGCKNLISGGDTDNNVLAGGFFNCILGGAYQFMGGGYRNLISGAGFSALIGGCQNSIISQSVRSRSQDQLNIIAGGSFNLISGCLNSIVGGLSNSINGSFNAILAGSENIIKNASCITILAGYKVSGSHAGSTIIGDRANRNKSSDSKDALTLDFISGTYIKNKIIFQGDDYIPSASTSFGISGQIAYDSNYHYRYDGAKWKRTALSEW
jgi:hypothetical protein